MTEEQKAFEAWAKSQGLSMEQHPLHYLFLDPKTDAARDGWNAARRYMQRIGLEAGLGEADHLARKVRDLIEEFPPHAAVECIHEWIDAWQTRRVNSIAPSANAGPKLTKDDMSAIELGASVLARIEEREARKAAIRNALTTAMSEGIVPKYAAQGPTTDTIGGDE